MVLAATAQAQPAGVQPPVSLPSAQAAPRNVAVTTLFPGGGSPPSEDPIARVYQDNSRYINDGKRLFGWYNCSGCHANGGGGMGPALTDNQWRYGGRLDQIFSSIAQGRPNGMPHWAGKIPDAQIWELAAFVRSLSVPTPANAGNTAAKPPPKSEAPGVQTAPK
jgi:cytochrome c oxidase cbb3-type subunit 3